MDNEQSYEALDIRLKVLETNTVKLEVKIEELLEALNQFKGVITTLKIIFYIAATLVAAVVWVKEHVKL